MNLRRMRRLIVGQFALSAFAILTARAQAVPPEIAPILERERWLNDKCRDGSGDDPATADYCAIRDRADEQLRAKGWCWGRPDQAEYQKKWAPCVVAPPIPSPEQQQIDEARALTLEEWASYARLVTTIEIGFKCGVVEQSLANLAVQRISIMMDEQKANNGLINDRTLDVGAAIGTAIDDGRRIADLQADPQICAKFFASPADRARVRQTVDFLIQ
jgi:hypothetical protein